LLEVFECRGALVERKRFDAREFLVDDDLHHVHYTLRGTAILAAVATAAAVERAIRSMMKSLDDASPDPGTIPDRTVLCVLTDLDAAWSAELVDSRMLNLQKADPSERTDVRIKASSDDLIALIEGRLNIATAFLTGRVKIDASAVDLLRIRRLF
jgi:predicted lipid carrier protein YhbT